MSIYPFVCRSIYQLSCLSNHQSMHPSIHLTLYLLIFRSTDHLPTYLPTYLPRTYPHTFQPRATDLPKCLTIDLSIYLKNPS